MARQRPKQREETMNTEDKNNAESSPSSLSAAIKATAGAIVFVSFPQRVKERAVYYVW
jgi:hypothetical protein